jgi:hypothetical protein
MSDEAPLLFRKVLGSLRPANTAATEAMAAIDDSEVRVRITRTKGNVRRNALYWACLNVAAPMLSERIEGEILTVNLLHRILKKKAGKFRLVTLPSGDVIEDFDSISFAKMPEPERAEFITWALETLSKWLGVDVSDLRREGEAA